MLALHWLKIYLRDSHRCINFIVCFNLFQTDTLVVFICILIHSINNRILVHVFTHISTFFFLTFSFPFVLANGQLNVFHFGVLLFWIHDSDCQSTQPRRQILALHHPAMLFLAFREFNFDVVLFPVFFPLSHHFFNFLIFFPLHLVVGELSDICPLVAKFLPLAPDFLQPFCFFVLRIHAQVL